MTIPNWDFTGNTMVTTSFIRLTTDSQSKIGGLWNKVVSVLLFGFLWFLFYLFNNSFFSRFTFQIGKYLWNLKFLAMEKSFLVMEWPFGM